MRTQLQAMKIPLIKPYLAIALAIAILPATYAQRYGGPDPAVGGGGFPGQPTIDPTTGLPVPAQWKDPNWKDPDKVLADVSYDALPLAEVARNLREQFKDAFDVLIPNTWQNPNNPAASIDAGATPIKMQLKNVTASEVFNAMNVVFEIENTPLRWELQMNGKRPTAVIRVLQGMMLAGFQPPPPEPPRRMIYFVGDLVGDEKNAGMPVEKLLKTVEEIYQLSYGASSGALRFHKEAQLLIVTGSVDQVEFVQQTLAALRDKADLERKSRTKPAESKPKADQPKSP